MRCENINVSEFQEKMQQDDAVILDVRSPQELAEGSIPGYEMINIADPSFTQKIENLDRDKTYLIYCRSGARSGQACNYMLSRGFNKVYNLDGGIIAWNRETTA